MKYLNQLEYENMPYPTDLNHPNSDFATHGNVKRAGCGLCSICMILDRLVLNPLTLEECRDFAVETGANMEPGTSMKILAPAVAERFDLNLTESDDPADLKKCLEQGGAAVIHVGGDREGFTGTFSNGGHYIAGISVKDDSFCILDPSWRPDKYKDEPRKSRVREEGVWLYAGPEVLREAALNRSPAYYLFTRKSDR